MTSRPFLLRLIIPFPIMIVIVIGVTGAVVYWVGQQDVRLQQMHDLDRLVMLVRPMVPAENAPITREQTARIKDLASVLDTRITLIDGRGNVLLDTYRDPDSMDNHNQRP